MIQETLGRRGLRRESWENNSKAKMEADAWLVHTGQPEAENACGDQLALGFVNP